MRTLIKKIYTSIVLAIFIGSSFLTYTLNAMGDDLKKDSQNQGKEKIKDIRKDHILKDSFDGGKLERVKNSIKKKGEYRLLIESNDGIDTLTTSFNSGNTEKVEIKKIGGNKYMVRIPVGESQFSEERAKLSNDIIPSQLGGYTVIQPEIFEAFGNEYLTGESLDALWGMQKIGVPSFIEDLNTKSKISIGVLDTGIEFIHEDLLRNYNSSLSYDFISDDSGSIDDNGHGTEVAGVIGAQVNGKGVFGVNPNTDLISLKVLNQDGIGTTYDVLEALAYAKENHIPVINMSFGGQTGDPLNNPVCDAITDLKNNGTIIIVSAGNANQEVLNTIPAACPDAITVGASGKDNMKTSFSNYGNLVDLYAPGTDIYTTALHNSYVTVNGTSFSAPLVTGLVAKELAYNPNSTYDQILSSISNNYGLSTTSTNIPTSIPGSISSTNSGGTLSGSLSSGTVQPPIVIDYSTYKYYSGTFIKNGVTYGNSLYSSGFDLSGVNMNGVDIYTYNEYKNILSSNSGSFQALSVPASGLVGEWMMNGNTMDTSGNGGNGTAVNISYGDPIPSGQQSALLNNALKSNVYMNNFIGNGTGGVTFSAWIKYTTLPSAGYSPGIIMAGGGASPFVTHYLRYTNYPSGSYHLDWSRIKHGVGNSFNLSYNVTFSTGTWYHVVGTTSGTGSALYLNGTLVATGFSDTAVGGDGTYTDQYLRFGREHYTGDDSINRYLSGSLRSIRIYNRSLSATEVQSLYLDDGSASIVSNNTSNPYLSSYFASNPTLTYFANSGPDNITWMTNQTLKKESTDPGVSEKNATNLADPVNLATGEFTYENTLMSIPGTRIPYELKVQYKNQTNYNGPLGFNWDHNYNQYLSGETNGNILFYNGQLGTFRFIKSGSIFLRNDGLRATLVQSGSLYQINYDNGNVVKFNSGARLSQIQDPTGNALNFTYSGAYLSGVVDTLGHTFSYSYYDHNRLKSVTDFSGRKVEFSYLTGSTNSGNTYDMKDITLTNATGATKTINFEYATGSTEPLIHNITRLFDAKGQLYVSNTYDSGDRITSQTYGMGTLTYTYTLSGNAITKNTVVDKLGHKTEYSYDGSGNNTSIRYYNPSESNSSLYTYTYNSLGLMTKEKRPRGNGYTYTYDGSGNVIEKRMKSDVDASNSSNDLILTYTYNSKNQKLTETLPNDSATIYTRDTSGNILSKTLSGVVSSTGIVYSSTWNYTYSASGLLSTETTPVGKITRYSYSGGQINSLVRGIGTETSTGSFVYNPYGGILSSTDGVGDTKIFGYTPFDLVSTGTTAEGIIVGYEYDANNNKIRETRYLSGGTTAKSYFFYDVLDHLTGSLVETSNGTSVLTTITYDANGNVKTKKIGSGAMIQYSYNEFAKPIEERVIMVAGDSSKDRVTSYTYDANNNLISKTDPRGYTTSYTYDLYDRLTRVDDPLGNYTTTSYNRDNTPDTTTAYTSTGMILSRQKITYDNFGHATKKISYLDPVNSSGALTIEYVYSKDFEVISSQDPKSAITTYTYDSRGNTLTTTDPLGNTHSTTYNKRDQKSGETITPNTGTGIVSTSYAYDHDGRLISKTNSLGKTTYITYDNLGNVIRTKDEMGRITDLTRDYRGLSLTSTEYLSGQTLTTTSTYDDRENLTTLTDAKGQTTTYEYDGLSENTKIIYPDTTYVTLSYDKSGNLTSKTDPNGTIVTNTYDSLNHLISRNILTGSGVGGVTNEVYTYDALGRLTSGGDNLSGSLVFSYDPLSRLMSETQSLSGNTSTVGYAYDANGNLISLTHPNGKIETFTYDPLNRNTTVGYSGTTLATYSYSGLVQKSVSYNNGRTTSYSYDSLQRLGTITPDTTNIQTETLSYDDSSLITGDGNRTYSYDTLKRLISVVPTSTGSINQTTESYTYDKTGNRTLGTIGGSSTNYTTNTLDQYTSQSGGVNKNYTYDNNGNLKFDGTKMYVYDYNNRLIQVNQGTGTIAQYQYDVLGRRILKITPTEATSYVYAGDNIVQEIRNVGGLVLKKEYINGIGTDNIVAYDSQESINQDKITFCQVRVLPYSSEFTTYGYSSVISDCNAIMSSSTGITTKRYFYHTNHLGSVVGISDNSGNVVQSYSYDSFGKAYIVSGSGSGSGTLTSIDSTSNLYGNTRLFTGREYDKEVGFYFNRARYYDPSIGRFISRDPIGQNDQVNLYTYVANSPVNYVDRTGREKQLLEDIKNGNKFAVSLVGRNLNFPYVGFIGTHTFIMIDSENSKGITKTYTIGGQSVNGKLTGVFNHPDDNIHYDGLFGGGSVKQAIDITTPTGMTDSQFAQNIYNGYVDYNENHKTWFNLGSNMPLIGGGNCSNFATTVLYHASNNDANLQKQVEDLNSPTADWGIGETLY